jgi:hypothetical protein
MASDAPFPCRVIDGNKALPGRWGFRSASHEENSQGDVLPLLDSERLILCDAEPDHLTLCVEGIEIYVGNHAQRRGDAVSRQLGKLTVREA